MKLFNTLTEYGVFSKIFHWLSAAVLIIQIPLGFYLVDMDFSEKRITIENVHVTMGLSILYISFKNLVESTTCSIIIAIKTKSYFVLSL